MESNNLRVDISSAEQAILKARCDVENEYFESNINVLKGLYRDRNRLRRELGLLDLEIRNVESSIRGGEL
jgi:hypothetical protein